MTIFGIILTQQIIIIIFEKNKIITFNTVDFVNSLKKNIKNKVDIKLLDDSKDNVVKKSIKYKLKKYKIYDEKLSLLNNLKNYNLTIHLFLKQYYLISQQFLFLIKKFNIIMIKIFIYL